MSSDNCHSNHGHLSPGSPRGRRTERGHQTAVARNPLALLGISLAAEHSHLLEVYHIEHKHRRAAHFDFDNGRGEHGGRFSDERGEHRAAAARLSQNSHHVVHLPVLDADEQRSVAPAQEPPRRRQLGDAIPVLVQGMNGCFRIFVLNHRDDKFHAWNCSLRGGEGQARTAHLGLTGGSTGQAALSRDQHGRIQPGMVNRAITHTRVASQESHRTSL